MRIVSAYPRSGSSWLRFIICNLYYQNQVHDFTTVNHLFPALDVDISAVENPFYVKTHDTVRAAIFLHRHVGDVLISEWWYKKKYNDDFSMTLHEWLVGSLFGQNWRKHVNCYQGSLAEHVISYDELKNPKKLCHILNNEFSLDQINIALEKSSFHNMQVSELKGFGVYPAGNEKIKFVRSGRSNQWKELSKELQQQILLNNEDELKMLGYL